MKPLSVALCFLLAWPPGLSAETRPEDNPFAVAFLAGNPIKNADAPALDAAVAVQRGLARGETLQAYAERTRLAARGLGLDEESVEKAVQVYSRKAARIPPGSGVFGTGPPANLALSVPDANRERVQKLLNANAFGQDRVAGGVGSGGNPGGSLTAEDFRRLNQQPGTQLPLSLKASLAGVPALEVVPSVTDRGYARLRKAAAMTDDGSLSTWGTRKWLRASGLAQTLYGRGSAALGEFSDHPIDSTWNGATAAGNGFSNRMQTDFGEIVDGYRAFAAAPSFKGAGSLVSAVVLTHVDASTLALARPIARGVVAIGHGFVEDFTNVYKDGKALVLTPSASDGAELAASTALLTVNFVGFGTVGAGKTAAKVGGEVLIKEAVEVAAKEGVKQGKKTAVERAVREGPEAATTDAVKLVKSIKGAIKAANLPVGGRFRFMPDKRLRPGNPLPFELVGGEKVFIDRFKNKWVSGPYHGKPGLYSFEWDVQLSEAGRNAWGKFAKNGKNYINVTPDGALSH